MPKKKEKKEKNSKTTSKKKSVTRVKKQIKVKSASKKTTPKAKSAKRTVKPKTKQKSKVKKIPLVIASDYGAFYAINGSVLRSINDLYLELETMLDHEYLYHKENGDHFANWVREVLGDEECAKGLSKAVTKKKARTFLKKRLKYYEM